MKITIILFDLVYEEDRAKEGTLDECKLFLSEKRGFSIFHMNVCSLRAKHTELIVLFKALQKDFDCIILTEGHIDTEKMNIDQFGFDGYQAYCSQINIRKTDGIVIFVKTSLEHNIEEVEVNNANCMLVQIKKQNKLFSCLAIYRSPSGKIDTFLSDLSNILASKRQDNMIKIITEDININILDKNSKKVQQYLKLMCEHGYMSLVNKPTRVSKKTKICIDHIFVGPCVDDSHSTFILQGKTSDHFSTLLNIELARGNECNKLS